MMILNKRLSDAQHVFDKDFIASLTRSTNEKRKSKNLRITKNSPIYKPANQNSQPPFRRSHHDESFASGLIKNFAFKSKAGQMPNKMKKINQDVYICEMNMLERSDLHFFAVCDGHGQNGHLVSGFIKQNLPSFILSYSDLLCSQLKKLNGNFVAANVKLSLEIAFKDLSSALHKSNIECNFSGSTVVSLLIVDNHIYSANVGDSRAIIVRQENHKISAVPLSRDHKPDDPLEKEYVLAHGGRIESFKDFQGKPVGPPRVWLKYEQYPGLAMSRSVGDYIAKQAGVHSEPEILEFQISSSDKFIIIASDGVWEFLPNEEVANMTVPFWMSNSPEPACERIVREATVAWKKEDEVIDDITCILVFLNLDSE